MELGRSAFAGNFNYSDSPGFHYAVRYLYSVDLDQDGLDEIIFAGFETQYNTPDQYDNTKITIFGWSNGRFQDVTQRWLPGGMSQVEGVGDIAVGDFNGDGRPDLYLSANADMAYQVNAYQLINRGSSFEKISLGLSEWEHGVTSVDLNQDGYDDVVVFGYLHPVPFLMGGPNGLSKSFGTNNWPHTESFATNGSGGSAGDFFGDGTVSVVVVDNGTINFDDTTLSRVYINQDGITEGFSAPIRLPPPHLGEKSHDVRAHAIDFSDDGLLDVIVFSRESWDGSQWPINSRIQFLQNQGEGRFADVTSSRLIGYDTNTNVSYVPVFRDFNKDGLTDIFISDSSFNTQNRSTAILMQQQDGTFVETGRDVLSSRLDDLGGIASIAAGPHDTFYVVFENQTTGGHATVEIAPLSFPERNRSESLRGTQGDDKIWGFGGNDTIQASLGRDGIDGGEGLDWLRYGSHSDGFTIALQSSAQGSVDHRSAPGQHTDTLFSIERLIFADKHVALDIDSHPGEIYRTYKAAFNRTPDTEGLGYWIYQGDKGLSGLNMAYWFINSTEFLNTYGEQTSNEDFIDLLYRNVLERPADTEGYAYWNQQMQLGLSRAGVLWSFAEALENRTNTSDLIAGGIDYTPFMG